MLQSARDILDAIALLTPYEINATKMRYGPACDGGYILASILKRNSPVLSFGAGSDISFEVELAQRGHEVALFDHTVSTLPADHPRIRHFPHGIAGASSDDGMMVTLEAALVLSGMAGRSDILLKMDVEGSEFNSLTRPAPLRCFQQIALEVHWMSALVDQAFRASFIAMMTSLLENFTIFHVHANNCASLHFVGGVPTDAGEMGGIPIADVLEISLIRNDLILRSANVTSYPTHLDYPNRPDRPDHLLGFFPFQNSNAQHQTGFTSLARSPT